MFKVAVSVFFCFVFLNSFIINIFNLCNQCKTILLFHVNVVNGHAANSHPSACDHIETHTKHLNRRSEILSDPLISHRDKCLGHAKT